MGEKKYRPLNSLTMGSKNKDFLATGVFEKFGGERDSPSSVDHVVDQNSRFALNVAYKQLHALL